MRRRLALRLLAAGAVVVGSSAAAIGCGSSADTSPTTTTPGTDSGTNPGDGSVNPTGDGSINPPGDSSTGVDSGTGTMGFNSSTCATANVFLNAALSTPANADDNATGLAAGDFNKDGRTDFAQQGTKSDMTVYLSNGDGTFKSTLYPAGSVERGNGELFEVADVDGDGNLDIVYAGAPNSSGDAVAVRLGKGDGTFGDGALISDELSAPIEYAQFADLNGDGKLDMVARLQDDPFVLLNTGGKFSAPTALAGINTSRDVRDSFHFADLNNDAKTDLAYTDGAGICAAFGDGTGNFATPACSPSATGVVQIEAIKVADVNGDGNIDMVLANFSTAEAVNVFLNKGAGVFGGYTTVAIPGVNASDVVIADFNNDKKLDLAVYQEASFDLALVYGKGDGTFSTTPELIGTGQDVYAPVLVGNFLGDGLPGMVVTDTVLNTLTVVNETCRTAIPSPAPITGDGGTVAATCTTAKVTDGTAVSITGTSSYQSVLAIDMNGDGKADLLQPGGSSGKMFSFALSNGDGTFKAVQEAGSIGSGEAIAAGDLNGDGLTDVVVPSDPTHYLVSLNTGNATFSTPIEYAFANSITGQAIGAASLADVNNDGHLDLFLDDTLLLGLGDGTFAGYGVETPFFALEGRPVTADLNGDKQLDVVYTGFVGTDGSGFCVALNVGNGNFATPVCTAGGPDTKDLDVADVNGDGKADVVVANSDATEALDVYLGKGDGTFGAKATFNLADSGAAGIRLHDFDNDGKVDVLVWNTVDGSFVLVPGAGDGTFSGTAKTFAGGAMGGNTSTGDIAIGDFVGAGLYGFATPNVSRPGVDVYVAKCTP